MADLLTQENFPRLWLLFQRIFGGTRAKRRLGLAHLGAHKTVLEIGCSVGLVSEVFAKQKGISFLGIDIDAGAIDFAKRRLAHLSQLEFECIGLEELAEAGRRFDYVLFANILHHTDDDVSVALLRDAARLVAPGGSMVLMEPDILREGDSFLIRQLYKLEKGQYRRSPEGYRALIDAAGLECLSMRSEDVSIDTLPGITCGHLLLFEVR